MEPRLMEPDLQSQGFLPARKPGDKTWGLQHSAPWQSRKLVLEKSNPFQGLQIASTDPLNELTERQPCPKCAKSRKFFCYNCYVAVAPLQNHIPVIRLPIKIHVVKHPKETEGKSTAVHAPLIAPEDVQMYTYPDIPDYSKLRALLVFPGKQSRSLNQIVEDSTTDLLSTSEEEEHGSVTSCDTSEFPYTTIVFIDSTWNQCKGMILNKTLAGLPCVIIESRNTIFWRYQKGKPKEYLATIEAIYYFLVDYHQIVIKKEYLGEYDNMLFFFKFMYSKIHELYDHNTLRAYTRD